MNFAPVAILACKRPEHLARLLTSLSANPEALETTLTIFIGGPMRDEDWELVRNTVSVAQEATGFRHVNVETCFELTASNELIEHGISSILTSNSRVIVLEDDLVVRRDFLLYMNTSLERYQDDKRVVQISGWNFGIMKPKSPQQTHFLSNTTSWGWATWKRAWKFFERDSSKLYLKIKSDSKLTKEFNYGNSYNFLKMLDNQSKGRINSWAIRWYASAFLNNLYTLYPKKSYVNNLGFDNNSTHSNNFFFYNSKLKFTKQKLNRVEIKDNSFFRNELENFFKKQKWLRFIHFIKYKIF